MAKQTAKKPAAKKTVAKKTVAKPATKKTFKKVVATPAVEHSHCCCEHKCACKCHHSGIFKRIVLFVIIFALGFASAKMCCMHKKHKMMPRPEFENGCLVVKCPKMAEKVQMMDADKDGCVSVEEFKAAKKHHMPKMKKHRKHKRMPQPQQPVVTE
ncbi:MAG: hypothetical protein IKZ34_01995 [Alphaproteobacteria bacterium]|nr:hypothetical protein [Alphaproteobacteria bacterium]